MKNFNDTRKSILRGLEKAIAYSKGNKKLATNHKIEVLNKTLKE